MTNDETGKPNPSFVVPFHASGDERWMAQALAEANLARGEGEVPVGAVAVLKGRIIGRGHNRNDVLQDPTAHAEIIALSAAAQSMRNWRLSGVTLYVTMEPCLMCTGALILSRVRRLVFGVSDEKFGACGSVYDIPWDNRFHHRLEVRPGVMEDECRRMLQLFFKQRRPKQFIVHSSRFKGTEDQEPETKY